nr:MAG TPA: hypothetical protein [Caudoviricetes sp.]
MYFYVAANIISRNNILPLRSARVLLFSIRVLRVPIRSYIVLLP